MNKEILTEIEQNYEYYQAYITKRTSDSDFAKEVIHEVFIDMLEKKEKLEFHNIKSFLKVCIKNKMLSMKRGNKFIESETVVSSLQAHNDTPEKILQTKQTIDIVKSTMDKLPMMQKATMRFYLKNIDEDMTKIYYGISNNYETFKRTLSIATSFYRNNLTAEIIPEDYSVFTGYEIID